MVLALLDEGRVDPREVNSRVLFNAAYFGYIGIVEALLRDGRADPRGPARVR
jgi:hypothetical protein